MLLQFLVLTDTILFLHVLSIVRNFVREDSSAM